MGAENWLAEARSTKPDLRTVASSVTQGSILLCNIFSSDWDYGAECTLRKFADGTGLGGVTDVPDGHAAVQRHLSRTNERTGTLWSFKRKNAKSCSHGEQPCVAVCAGGCPAGKQLCRRGPGGLESTNMNMSQWCVICVYLRKRLFYCQGHWTLVQGAQRDCEVSVIGDLQFGIKSAFLASQGCFS